MHGENAKYLPVVLGLYEAELFLDSIARLIHGELERLPGLVRTLHTGRYTHTLQVGIYNTRTSALRMFQIQPSEQMYLYECRTKPPIETPDPIKTPRLYNLSEYRTLTHRTDKPPPVNTP